MKAYKFYSSISATYSSAVIVLLFMTDVLYLADKSKLSLIICMFGAMEFVKYFIFTFHFPDAFKALNAIYFTYSVHKSSSDIRLKKVFEGMIRMAIMTALIHVAIILLGAGVIENFAETFLLSVLLSVLTFLPLCLYFGPTSCLGALFNIYPDHFSSFEVTLRQTAYITVFGAWVGAFVIPLDWDRPWQKWPLPCALGAISGYCTSHIIKLPSSQKTKFSV